MRVIGGFIEARSGDVLRHLLGLLTDVTFHGDGNAAEAVIRLCEEHHPEVIIVGPKFCPAISDVRRHFAAGNAPEPLWVGFMGLSPEGTIQIFRQHGVFAEIGMNEFSDENWIQVLRRADRKRMPGGSELRIVTALSSPLTKTTLHSLLAPWSDIHVGSNHTDHRNLLAALRDGRPHLVIFDDQLLDEVASAHEMLRTSQELLQATISPSPTWVLMTSQLDPVGLIRTAMLDVRHMFASDQLPPSEEFAESLRLIAHGASSSPSPLAHIHSLLGIANDDDDRRILQLVVTGAKNATIAKQVFLSEQTVKNRLSRMMHVANVDNRTEFALLFMPHRYLRSDLRNSPNP